jgi:hypothetical protein
MAPVKKPLQERFWPKVQKRGADECWPWAAGLNSNGYGRFQIGSTEQEGAHRVAYRLERGSIAAGLCVCHSCDNPRCCNPAHLWLGTSAENTRDRDLKGRGRNQQRDATHCKHGHEFTPENTYRRREGGRKCRTCMKAQIRGWKAAHR